MLLLLVVVVATADWCMREFFCFAYFGIVTGGSAAVKLDKRIGNW
uniref:Uncharacterized protein n=1 Tax=Rhizophora mucronata TaxID=61149 RepID=A0A2P2IJV6_RHIMU